MVPNQQTQTLLERLNSKGSVSVADVYQEIERIVGLRHEQGHNLTTITNARWKPKRSVPLAVRLLRNADKVLVVLTGVMAGVRVMRRIKRLFR